MQYINFIYYALSMNEVSAFYNNDNI